MSSTVLILSSAMFAGDPLSDSSYEPGSVAFAPVADDDGVTDVDGPDLWAVDGPPDVEGPGC